MNMAGGQPFSLDNLEAVRALTREYAVPLFLDATRLSENAVFVKDREPGLGALELRQLIRELASLSDGAVFSSKKDHFVPIGGFLAVNDEGLAERLREELVLFEGFAHYGGMAGHDMEALAVGIREAADEAMVRHVIAQAAYLGHQLIERGVPIVVPVGAHAVFLDAKRILPHVPQSQLPAQSLAAALYLAGGVRSMERGIVSGQHGTESYDGLELVRLTLPRRVYTQEHLDYVVGAVEAVCREANDIPGLAFTYEPERLRFFLGRFEPVAAYPLLNARSQCPELTVPR